MNRALSQLRKNQPNDAPPSGIKIRPRRRRASTRVKGPTSVTARQLSPVGSAAANKLLFFRFYRPQQEEEGDHGKERIAGEVDVTFQANDGLLRKRGQGIGQHRASARRERVQR